MPSTGSIGARLPSRSRDFNVIGIVAAVLAVLKVLAITFSAPRRNRAGDILATTDIWNKYHTTWRAKPRTTTRISQINEAKTCMPSFWPTLAATMPKTASGTSATTQSKTFIINSNPMVSKSSDYLKRGFAPGFLLIADLDQADAESQGQYNQLRQMVLGEGLADRSRHQVQEQVGRRFPRQDGGGRAGCQQRGTNPRLDQVGQRQPDQHRDQSVQYVKSHHQSTQPPLDSLVTIALRMARTTRGAARAVRLRRMILGKRSKAGRPLPPQQSHRESPPGPRRPPRRTGEVRQAGFQVRLATAVPVSCVSDEFSIGSLAAPQDLGQWSVVGGPVVDRPRTSESCPCSWQFRWNGELSRLFHETCECLGRRLDAKWSVCSDVRGGATRSCGSVSCDQFDPVAGAEIAHENDVSGLPYARRDGPANMALDEALLDIVAAPG